MCGSFIVLNSGGVDKKITEACVVEKHYEKPHTTTILVCAGKGFVPVTNYYPESWNITLNCKLGEDTISISEKEYNEIKINDTYRVYYIFGRFDNKFKIIKLYNYEVDSCM